MRNKGTPAACPGCGNRQRIRPGRTLFRCGRCSLIFRHPVPSREYTRRLYGSGYFKSRTPLTFGYKDYLSEKDNFLKTFEKKSSLITRFIEKGSIMDIGCAAGFFLKVMKDRGWKTHGIDISPDMCRYARKTLGLPRISRADISTAVPAPGKFHFITMWNTIEHLRDPRTVLGKVRKALKEDGLLLVQTHDISSLLSRIMGKRWHQMKTREHFLFFNRKSLLVLLGSSGFTPVLITRNRGGRFVTREFIRLKAQRYGGLAKLVTALLPFPAKRSVYINTMDELIVIARKKAFS